MANANAQSGHVFQQELHDGIEDTIAAASDILAIALTLHEGACPETANVRLRLLAKQLVSATKITDSAVRSKRILAAELGLVGKART